MKTDSDEDIKWFSSGKILTCKNKIPYTATVSEKSKREIKMKRKKNIMGHKS